VSLRVLDVLEGEDTDDAAKFEVTDDLQAMFLVFIWICILYTGPNGEQRTPSPRDKGLLTYEWSGGGIGLTRDGVVLANRSKTTFIQDEHDTKIDLQFTQYFDALKQVAKEWKTLVASDARERKMAIQEKREPIPYMTHEKIINILSCTLSLLPDQDTLFNVKCRAQDDNANRNPKKRRMSLG
jgi:hypothetical protein